MSGPVAHSTYHVLLLQVSQLKVVILAHLPEDIADRVADNLQTKSQTRT